MKTKKKEHPSGFTRGEKVTGKKHGRKHGDGRRKEEPGAFGQPRKPDEGTPTA
jgi:hypothetical protein